MWVEKQALESVIARSATRMDVSYLACKGYMSQSEMEETGQRFRRYMNNGQTPVIIHLGDHDPSGIDMSRDILDRLTIFIRHYTRKPFEVERIALNMNQVEENDLPPNPAKVTDSRFISYQQEYGEESWELDALTPSALDDLITGAIRKYQNEPLYRQVVEQERREKATLEILSDKWGDFEAALKDEGITGDELIEDMAQAIEEKIADEPEDDEPDDLDEGEEVD